MSPRPATLICAACGAANRAAAGRPLSAARCGKCAAALATLSPVGITGERLAALRRRDDLPFLLDVWAPWCGPCRMMAPALEEVAQSFAERLRVFKLNSDEHPDAAGALGVRGLPTLILFAGGQVTDTVTGLQPASALMAWLNRQLGPVETSI